MKRCLIYFAGAVAAAAVVSLVWPTASQPVAAQSRATATNVPVIPHESVPNFFKNAPGIYTGENMGIATNSKGNIYIYHRAYETRLFEYAPDGKFVREIGRNNYGFAFAHSVRVDAQDNIWAVDEGTDQLVKFSPDGNRVVMVIGRREDPVAMLSSMPGGGVFHGRNEKYRFGRQTDVAFDQQGNIFVSDGYFDARVVKYDKNGRFVKAVGTRGNANLQFNTPHSIATDFQGNVYVGDRGNARVQVLDNDLNWKANYTERRQSVGRLRVGRAGPEEPREAVPLLDQLVARQRAGGRRRNHRRGLQDGARRHDRRQVRPRRQGARRVRHDPPDGLPRSERHLHGRNQQLAVAENPAEAASDHREQVRRNGHETHAHRGVSLRRLPCGGGSLVAQIGGSGNRVRHQRRSPQDAVRHPRRRGRRRRRELEGTDLRLHADRPSRTRRSATTARSYRGGSRLFQFDQNGKFVRELGQDVYGFNAAYRPARRSAG